MRQSFSKAVISGTRSGSGKVVYEHYDSMKLIWGGSANTQPLQTGVDSSMVANKEGKESEHDSFTDVEYGHSNNQSDYEDDLESEADDSSCLDFSRRNCLPNSSPEGSSKSGTSSNAVSQKQTPIRPRKRSLEKHETPTSIVPKLVDNKRKHMERALSAAQRDGILLNDAKEDRVCRNKMVDVMKTSSESIASALEKVGDSMILMSNSLSRSMETLAQSLSAPQQIQQDQAFNFQNQYQQQSYRGMLYQNQHSQHSQHSTVSSESPEPFYNSLMKE